MAAAAAAGRGRPDTAVVGTDPVGTATVGKELAGTRPGVRWTVAVVAAAAAAEETVLPPAVFVSPVVSLDCGPRPTRRLSNAEPAVRNNRVFEWFRGKRSAAGCALTTALTNIRINVNIYTMKSIYIIGKRCFRNSYRIRSSKVVAL